nr:2-dehydropantoate 2-reductase [uncultured Dyadobacter sp.]
MLLDTEHIYIIGSGAVGRALAVFLTHSGKGVTIIRGSVNDGSVKSANFSVRMPDGALLEAEVNVATLNAFPAIEGIIVVAAKSYANKQLAADLKGRTGDSPIVLLQNGLGIEQPFVAQHFREVYRAVLLVTSQVIDETTVRFKPVAACPVGIECGSMDHLSTIIGQLSTPQFVFESKVNLQSMIWKKAIVNCVFNSVCPLLEIDNGIFHRDPHAIQIARRVISECLFIAHQNGIDLLQKEVEDSLLEISIASDGQLISTLQDIRSNRHTEIDTLNLEIVRLAEEMGKSEAVRETRLLGELTKLKAQIRREKQQ